MSTGTSVLGSFLSQTRLGAAPKPSTTLKHHSLGQVALQLQHSEAVPGPSNNLQQVSTNDPSIEITVCPLATALKPCTGVRKQRLDQMTSLFELPEFTHLPKEVLQYSGPSKGERALASATPPGIVQTAIQWRG